MRRNQIAGAVVSAAVTSLLATSAAVAQLDDDFIEPEQYPGLRTALVRNANAPAEVNEAIDVTLSAAHERVGGKVGGGKRSGYLSLEPQADRRAVVTAVRDLARDGAVDIVFIDGGDSQSTVGFAASFPNTVFIDLEQPAPCVDAAGRPDRTGACAGGVRAIPANHVSVPFEIEDPAYLAGVLAASASSSGRIGIISGMADCDECNRYIHGFVQGARSVEPDLGFELAYLADDDESQAFGDVDSATTFAKAFIDVYQPEVLLPVAGDASVGMIAAACDAGLLAIGIGIDVATEHPELADCVLASITKDIPSVVRDTLYDFTSGFGGGRVRPQTLESGGVGLTEEWRRLTTLPLDTPTRYDEALSDLISGAVEPCPSGCGDPLTLTDEAAAAASSDEVGDEAASGEASG